MALLPPPKGNGFLCHKNFMKTYKSLNEIEQIPIDKELFELLLHLETVNSSDQKYYLDGETLVVTYRLRLNILTFFSGIKISIPIRILGLPISLERSGIIGDETLLSHFLKEMKGLTLALNLDNIEGNSIEGNSIEENNTKKVLAETLPSYVFDNQFNSFDEYLCKLRTSYRHRIRKALKKGESLTINKTKKENFRDEHYQLYLEVYNRSKYPLECLPITYFKTIEADIFTFETIDGKALGFVQLLEKDDTLFFMFCGFDKDEGKKYDIYYNMLLFIIKEGINRRVKLINFGQTSSETKLKLGCRAEKKYLIVHHSIPFINKLLKIITPYLSYKEKIIPYRVFKEEK